MHLDVLLRQDDLVARDFEIIAATRLRTKFGCGNSRTRLEARDDLLSTRAWTRSECTSSYVCETPSRYSPDRREKLAMPNSQRTAWCREYTATRTADRRARTVVSIRV